MRYFQFLLCSVFLIAVSCGGSPSSLEGNDTSDNSSSYPNRALLHWSPYVEWDRSMIEEAAESKIAVFPIEYCFSPNAGEVIGEMKAINPEIKIIGYRLLLGAGIPFSDTATVHSHTPYQIDFYNFSKDHWAWTTTGDTLSGWPGNISLNPFTDGSLDREFITEQLDFMEACMNNAGSYLDGIMHDYFRYSFHIDPSSVEGEKGDIDLDGDGVIFEQDPDEQEGLLQWQIEFARGIRNRFGEDFIQIGNGRVPQENAELAGEINGIFYEKFPNMCWGVTDHEGFQILLENQEPGYLRESCGRTWSLLTHVEIDYNNYFCLVSSLLADCLYTEVYGKYLFSGWEYDIHPGVPVSGLQVEGRVDSVISYSREYSFGTAKISFADYGGRITTEFVKMGY